MFFYIIFFDLTCFDLSFVLCYGRIRFKNKINYLDYQKILFHEFKAFTQILLLVCLI